MDLFQVLDSMFSVRELDCPYRTFQFGIILNALIYILTQEISLSI